jgi:hypothetical protein
MDRLERTNEIPCLGFLRFLHRSAGRPNRICTSIDASARNCFEPPSNWPEKTDKKETIHAEIALFLKGYFRPDRVLRAHAFRAYSVAVESDLCPCYGDW